MSAGSEAVLYDIFGDPMAVEVDTAIPAGTAILINGGSDGTNARYIKVDSSGNQVMIGLGTAGSPAGGVISIQGVGGGTAVPISGSVSVTGSVTTTNLSIGSNGSAIPTSSTQVGGSDGTNLQALRVFDVDTGGGTQYVLGVSLRKSAGGGSVDFGTSSDPIRVDPTGTTTQPVSGTVTSNIGTTGGLALDTSVNGILRAQSSSTSGQSGPLVQGAVTTAAPTYTTGQTNPLSLTTSGLLRVDGSGVTQPISGTVTANAGTGNFTVVQATASNLRSQTSSESNTGAAIPTQASMVGGSDGTNLRAIFVDSSGRQIVVGAAASGAAVAGNPVLVAGSDGTNARTLRTATDGTLRIDPTGTTTQPVSGTVAATQSGAWTVTANAGTGNFSVVGTATDNTANSTAKLPVMAARANTSAPTWSDGNMVPLSVDTSGSLRITGAISATNPSVGSNNAAIPTSSTQIGGSDGTNLQATRVFDLDTGAGTQFVLGVGLRKAASGGSVELGTSSDPIRIDPTGTTTQPISGTVTANQGGTWTVQPGNTANTTPWLATINQGGNSAVVKAASTAAVATDPALVVTVSPNNIVFVKDQEIATFAALAPDIVVANNKSMLSLQNTTGSTVIIKVRKVFLRNSQTSAVTGVIGVFELRRFTSHSAGTVVTPVSYDTNDSLNVSVTARTGATITGEADLLARWEWSTDEWGVGTLDQEGLDHAMQVMNPMWEYSSPCKPIVLRANQGLHIKFATNSTAGTWDLRMVFTQE